MITTRLGRNLFPRKSPLSSTCARRRNCRLTLADKNSLVFSGIRSSSSQAPVYHTSSEETSSSSDWIARLEDARLEYPDDNIRTSSCPLTLNIQPATYGGHAILGPNSSGKSLLSNALAFETSLDGPDHPHLANGVVKHNFESLASQRLRKSCVSRVSFESHELLLAEPGLSVYSALTPEGGQLSKAAQFLVVRFGLYSFLSRDVSTLSTGEIRKVLLIRALSTRPRLLILDNAFDGLDVPSRELLKELVSKTLQGFRNDILVQGVNAKATAHTQVLLMTHRAEEIVKEISTVTFLKKDGAISEPRGKRSGSDLLNVAVGGTHFSSDPWDDESLPSKTDIQSVWSYGRNQQDVSKMNSKLLVNMQNLSVQRGEKTLLSGLNWRVEQGQRWLVAGGNGMGKSTLSRGLARRHDLQQCTQQGSFELGLDDNKIGWVSTELHLSMSSEKRSAMEVLMDGSNNIVAPEIAKKVASWLKLEQHQLDRSFCCLSQGEQKMVLIGAAVTKTPKLLIIDEPLQGLDQAHRHLILGLVERICISTDTSLVYVTHHFEELVPSVTHVLHLKDGRSVYNGLLNSYRPEEF